MNFRLIEDTRVERTGQAQHPLFPVDDEVLSVERPHRHEAGVVEGAEIGHQAHAGIDVIVQCDLGVIDRLRFLPRDEASRTADVDTDIAQRTATRLRLVADIVHVVVEEGKRPIDLDQLAQCTGTHDLARALHLRVVDDHEPLGRKHARPVTRLD